MAERQLLKDGLNNAAIKRIASGLEASWPEFDSPGFIRVANQGLQALELKQRVDHIIDVLHQFLPSSFAQTAKILCRLPKHWNRGNDDDALRGFAIWPLTDYAARYGLQHPAAAMRVMENLTEYFSAEFAIRPFLRRHFELSYQQMLQWSQSKDEHLRRLASEGIRPRLPWGMRLAEFITDPKPVLAILENLKLDSSLYVRRSVANNLNDISKDNPEAVIQTCQRWLKQHPGNENILWLVKHATRSLVKQGLPAVFPLLGYTARPAIKLETFELSNKTVAMGENISFDLTLSGAEDAQKIVLDFAIHFVKANGQTTAKVFKCKNLTLNKNQSLSINKSHSFKPISTRKYYPGEHWLSIHINGAEIAKKAFQLT